MHIPSASPINLLKVVISSFFHLPSCSSWSHKGKKLSTYSGNCRNGERLFTIPPVMRYKHNQLRNKRYKAYEKNNFLELILDGFSGIRCRS